MTDTRSVSRGVHCPKCGGPTRVSYTVPTGPDARIRVRTCKSCGATTRSVELPVNDAPADRVAALEAGFERLDRAVSLIRLQLDGLGR